MIIREVIEARINTYPVGSVFPIVVILFEVLT